MFAEAVGAIDRGDLGALRALLATHPELLTQRLENGRDDYFTRPYLLWFVAENPIRHGTLPANIVDIARALLDAGAEGRDYTLELVCSGQVPRECGVQLELIDVLVDAGADPNCLDPPLAHRENAAAERLLAHGARETLVAAACLGHEFDAAAATPEERQIALAGAALHGQAQALRDLIAAGIEDINAFNPPGWHAHSTALHSAVDSGSSEAVDVLLAAGADRTIKDTLFHGTPDDWFQYLNKPKGT